MKGIEDKKIRVSVKSGFCLFTLCMLSPIWGKEMATVNRGFTVEMSNVKYCYIHYYTAWRMNSRSKVFPLLNRRRFYNGYTFKLYECKNLYFKIEGNTLTALYFC